MDTNILLESGTNELEILEFTLEIIITESTWQRSGDFVIPEGYSCTEYTSERRRHFYAARGDDYGHQSEKVSWHGG